MATQPTYSHVRNIARDIEDDYDMIILSDESWLNPDLTEIYVLDDPIIPQMELL